MKLFLVLLFIGTPVMEVVDVTGLSVAACEEMAAGMAARLTRGDRTVLGSCHEIPAVLEGFEEDAVSPR